MAIIAVILELLLLVAKWEKILEKATAEEEEEKNITQFVTHHKEVELNLQKTYAYIYLFVVLDFRQRKNNIVRCVGLSLSSSISRAHTSLSFAKMKKNQTIALKTIDFIECPHTQFLLAKYRITEKESERVCVCVSSGVRKRKWWRHTHVEHYIFT